jgi:predicted nucleic acid-binding protein
MFIDTSGLLCYYSTDEPKNKTAERLFEGERHHLTHSYVLAEIVALAYVRKVSREFTLRFCSQLLVHPRLHIIWVDLRLHQEGLELLSQRPDKNYSLCDAVSFVLMKQYGIWNALNTDQNFEQEGFTCGLGSAR